jgi:hypothetical protein
LDDGPAADSIDLLSVLTHELGHLLGHGHKHEDPHDVMGASLQAGVRRLPTASYAAQVDAAIADEAVSQRVSLASLLASAR